MARNIVLRYLRKTATRRDDGEFGLRVIPLMGASPSSIAGARQEQRILVAALRRIPTPLQLVVELFYWEELTTREIAGVLGVPQGTVKWRLSEARDALKDEIESASSTSLAEATIRGLDSWARSIRGMVDEALAEG